MAKHSELNFSADPDEVWDRVASVKHFTSFASAARIPADDKTEVIGFSVKPSLAKNEPLELVIRLRAAGIFEQYSVEFEETAAISFKSPTILPTKAAQFFGTRIALPYLIPFVESGYARMCAELGETPEPFPFYSIRGRIHRSTNSRG